MTDEMPRLTVLEATSDASGYLVRIPSYRDGAAYVADLVRLGEWMHSDGEEVLVRLVFGEDERPSDVDEHTTEALRAWIALSASAGRSFRIASLRLSHDTFCAFALVQHHVAVHGAVSVSTESMLLPGLAPLLSRRGWSGRPGEIRVSAVDLVASGIADETFEGDALEALAPCVRHIENKKVGALGIVKAIERTTGPIVPS